MPSRKFKKSTKHNTTEVQGKGSWVEMLTPTYEDIELAMNGQDAQTPKSQMEMSKALLDRLVVAWNWVDDNDEPLPQPNEDPQVIKELPIQETLFLVGLVNVEGVDQKKLPRK